MRLVVLGAPGAGKGTQAHFLSRHYKIAHISTGDLLRGAVKEGTETGLQVAGLLETGSLVPDELVTGLLVKRLTEPDCANGFILDGFPRTPAQAEITEDIAGEQLNKVVSVHVDDDVIVDRMSGRRVCDSCGTTFNLHYKPPKKHGVCDACGGKLRLRNDDKAKTVRERLSVYHSQAEPIKSFFKKQGKLVVVDGMKEIEQITADIIAAIEG